MSSSPLPPQLPASSVRLDQFDNAWYEPGAGWLKRTAWFLVNALLIQVAWNPSSALRVFLLRRFGATVGRGVVIKPSVNIKYPWRLTIGDYVWIGEHCWIDNLANVTIESHVCVSQGALLLTGNHDYKRSDFALITGGIHLEQGSWVGARSVVGPGTTLASHAVLAVGSVAGGHLTAYTIYRGNPAVAVRRRHLTA